jgi:hypothetical protein
MCLIFIALSIKPLDENLKRKFLNGSIEFKERVAYVASSTVIIGENTGYRIIFSFINTMHLASNKYHQKLGKYTPHTICKEHILTINIVMYFRKNFFLIDAFNEKLSLFLSSGIVSHIIDKYVETKYWNVKRTESGFVSN